ncbi:unnamed protein product [Symbiodinium necroappetens]|uniref:Uncharacterized protein n=1 Tax=Symbiodinium necroappetens TaxID=1628268 RepID=A0A813BZN2_9DINO|nr:unnamed protein product [Symbiodinium necroappetens]
MSFPVAAALYRDMGDALNKLVQRAQGDLSDEDEKEWTHSYRQLQKMISQLYLARQKEKRLITKQGPKKLDNQITLAWKCRRQADVISSGWHGYTT